MTELLTFAELGFRHLADWAALDHLLFLVALAAPYRATDWRTLDTTTAGMSYRGRILNVLIDCTSGMITFEWFGLKIPFRTFSPRALAVHKPREACVQRGFEPGF